MKKATAPTCLFLDIGGVLLTDGWSLGSRKLAVKTFDLDPEEMETRHHQAFGAYEVGKLTLDDYLDRAVFHRKRPFSRAAFRKFMFAQSKPYPEMIELIPQVKAKYGLKIVVVSNEGRELNAHRIRTFRLDAFVDSFISSCYVHLRKPDADIYRLALDIAHAPPGEIVYLENTPMFIDAAKSLGIRGILHTDCQSTRAKLAAFGLPLDEKAADENG